MKDSQSAAPLNSTQSECFSTHYFGFMACNFTALVHIHPSHQHHFRLQRASVYNEKALRKKKPTADRPKSVTLENTVLTQDLAFFCSLQQQKNRTANI